VSVKPAESTNSVPYVREEAEKKRRRKRRIKGMSVCFRKKEPTNVLTMDLEGFLVKTRKEGRKRIKRDKEARVRGRGERGGKLPWV